MLSVRARFAVRFTELGQQKRLYPPRMRETWRMEVYSHLLPVSWRTLFMTICHRRSERMRRTQEMMRRLYAQSEASFTVVRSRHTVELMSNTPSSNAKRVSCSQVPVYGDMISIK